MGTGIVFDLARCYHLHRYLLRLGFSPASSPVNDGFVLMIKNTHEQFEPTARALNASRTRRLSTASCLGQIEIKNKTHRTFSLRITMVVLIHLNTCSVPNLLSVAPSFLFCLSLSLSPVRCDDYDNSRRLSDRLSLASSR